MSRPRIVDGIDERGRPRARWADVAADEPRYGHMEPAHVATIERRRATPEELEAVRARDEASRRPLIVVPPRPQEVRPVIDIAAIDAATARMSAAAGEAVKTRNSATAAWTSAAIAEVRAKTAAAELEGALADLHRILGAPVPEISVEPISLPLAQPVSSPKTRAKRTATREQSPPGELTSRQREILDAVVAANGNRRAASESVGTALATVEATLENIGKKGRLPADLIPFLPARCAKYATVAGR